MVDGLLELRLHRSGVRTERRIVVHKLRGSGFLEGEHGFQAREHGHAVAGDAIRVLAFQETAAAQLVDHDPALGAYAGAMQAQFQQPVHHGVLRRGCRERCGGQQEHGAQGGRGQRLQLVGEPLDPGSGTEHRLHRAHAVEHQQRCTPGQHLAAQEGGKAVQPLVLQDAVGADIGDLVGRAGRVEEPHRAQMRHHAAVIFPQHGDEQCPAALAGMVEQDLVGQDRLARAGRTLDRVQAALQEAAAQDGVQAGHEAACPRDLAGPVRAVGLKLRHGRSGPKDCGATDCDARDGGARGSLTVKVDPSPGWLDTAMRPPMPLTR